MPNLIAVVEAPRHAAGPDVWYHGSKVKISRFTLDHLGQGHDQEGPGVYLTADLRDACGYAGPGGFVHECRLRVKKPLPVTGRVQRSLVERLVKAAPDLETTLSDWDEDPRRAMMTSLDHCMNGTGPADVFQNVWITYYRYREADYLRNVVRLTGFDVTYPQRPGNTVRHAVVFDPDLIQIVRAIPYAEASAMHEAG